ncbi:hypothetical protein NDU88_000542 [Pleurodeles waltl]|uniref:Uncharacterized protein n=1 Tax=Pleurodeles waltl TaxID=8319 RepID=A0AAV7WFT0_PLEWA|nr:hypothetical protein NDU88_000542 [Pleurodeles waltl]
MEPASPASPFPWKRKLDGRRYPRLTRNGVSVSLETPAGAARIPQRDGALFYRVTLPGKRSSSTSTSSSRAASHLQIK